MVDLELKIDGKSHAGWKSVTIMRSMEAMAGTFLLSVSDRWNDDNHAREILPGQSSKLIVGGEVLITGHIDDVATSYDHGSHDLRISGRDKTADLVDCSAMNRPGQWKNRRLEQIVNDLISPFNIGLIVDADTGDIFTSFATEKGETIYEAIERLCRMRGLLATSDRYGNLLITRASNNRMNEVLKRGKNILSARGEFSHRDRFSDYVISGQQPALSNISPEQANNSFASANDAGIRRYRPLLVRAEQAVSKKAAKDRAIWESNIRAARSRKITITVAGWHISSGKLWEVNHLVAVDCDWLGISQDMLISSATYLLDDQGTRAELELVLPGSYELLEDAGGDGWLL